ncbi:hypothetical protein HNP52_000794 [Sphingomonas kyeonggiensis]|uniref:YD repeat-containing protein n=1 Tax=Sphingomonas kyeonggiensis TaxID=1268553 RepID=A0A7W7JYL8_9SPHN|nr:hypothetical protein [Sphingomonas kyeonggiensis]MBB4837743.1 hypothetical protein [Sphingomonas kyeonggiensis]
MRYFKRLALPACFIVLGITTLSATAAPPLGNDLGNYAGPGPVRLGGPAGTSALMTTSSSSAGETVNYTYDELGRLISVKQEGTVNNGVESNYSLDKAGNRTNVKVTGVP